MAQEIGGGSGGGNFGGSGTGGSGTGGTGGTGGGILGGLGATGAGGTDILSALTIQDTAQNVTPAIPAGAYDYGSGKVYTAFTVEDVVEGQTERVTRGLWSNNVGELTTFVTSSTLSSTQKQYYYEIYNGDDTVSTNAAQFSIAYGHYAGSGSLGTNEDSPSNAIYSQFQQILLPSTQTRFSFEDTNQDDIYVISINRARLKDKLDPGNWELVLSGSGGETLRLIDDSGDRDQTGTNPNKNVYNVVSGSITNGVQNSTEIFGAVYPQFGTIILGAAALDASASLGTNRTSNTDAQNHNKLFLAISGAAVENSDDGFQARSEEEVKSTFFFVRAKNGEYNFSNNPSYVSGSVGKLRQQTFIGDPKTYITSVGLYNNNNELLAIAKLSKPLLKSYSNEILVKVKLDF